MPGFVVLLFCFLYVGCQPKGRPGVDCLKVREGGDIVELAWVDAGRRLVVQSESGPFDSASPSAANFTEVTWPGRQERLVFSAPRAYGTHITADGTFYWLENDGIWQLGDGAKDPEDRVALDEAERVVESWDIAGSSILVMRTDHGNAVEEYQEASASPSVRIPSDPNAYFLWASDDGRTVIVTRSSAGEPLARFAVHRADGETAVVDTGVGLPILRWLSRDGQRIVFQQSNAELWMARIDGSAAPTLLRMLPRGVDAMSAPSPDGLVAYSGGGTGPSTVCFADGFPQEALP